jgi:hypothetical protein
MAADTNAARLSLRTRVRIPLLLVAMRMSSPQDPIDQSFRVIAILDCHTTRLTKEYASVEILVDNTLSGQDPDAVTP